MMKLADETGGRPKVSPTCGFAIYDETNGRNWRETIGLPYVWIYDL
jgi:hypothetical protein